MVLPPFHIRADGHDRAEHDQRDAEGGPAPRDARERRQELDDSQPGHHEGQRGPVPGQERALVGEGEPGVRLLLAARLTGGPRHAGLAVWVTVLAARGSSPGPPALLAHPWG